MVALKWTPDHDRLHLSLNAEGNVSQDLVSMLCFAPLVEQSDGVLISPDEFKESSFLRK